MKLLMSLMRTAWAMPERALKAGIAVLSRDEWFAAERMQTLEERQARHKEALEARRGDPIKGARYATVRDGVATIAVEGVIFRRASSFDVLCGDNPTTYAVLMRDLQAALD